MLSSQVNYWSLQESKRHNLASEGETRRHNVTTENLGMLDFLERRRHNTSVEYETARSNIAHEVETKRHNIANEHYQNRALTETTRHNLQMEDYEASRIEETSRHNLAMESIDQYRNKIDEAKVKSEATIKKETLLQDIRATDRRLDIEESRAALDRERYETDKAQGWSRIVLDTWDDIADRSVQKQRNFVNAASSLLKFIL